MSKEKYNMSCQLQNSYLQLPSIFYSSCQPTSVRHPQLILYNTKLAESLGLCSSELSDDELAEYCTGNKLPHGAKPIAQAYAGHQFGQFTMLGDGRAVLLGEIITQANERRDIGLKGSGITPYSRGGDGRAALGPMLREYIISEAMHALGIPTTRSLAVVRTGEMIQRESKLQGAVLTRVAQSHLRVGTFQYVSWKGHVEQLRVLADYAIERHYQHIPSDNDRYIEFLREVILKQANLVAKWQSVGFIHGVMNTDNMTISGETIDYGPCAFMDRYHPDTVFSSIDRNGRYAYRNQPYMAAWNLARFAESLLPLLHENQEEAVERAQHEISKFTDLYERDWYGMMRSKLGIFSAEEEDRVLIQDLLGLLEAEGLDYSNTFRELTINTVSEKFATNLSTFSDWYNKWHSRIQRQSQGMDAVRELMQKNNPAVIPRNHLVEKVLHEAVTEGNDIHLKEFIAVLQKPYQYGEVDDVYMTPPPKDAPPYRTYCGT